MNSKKEFQPGLYEHPFENHTGSKYFVFKGEVDENGDLVLYHPESYFAGSYKINSPLIENSRKVENPLGIILQLMQEAKQKTDLVDWIYEQSQPKCTKIPTTNLDSISDIE